jgi:hypothetical protein
MIASRARSGPLPLPPVLPEASNPLPVIAPSLTLKPGSMVPNPPRSRAWMKGSHRPYFQIRKSFPDPVSFGKAVRASVVLPTWRGPRMSTAGNCRASVLKRAV